MLGALMGLYALFVARYPVTGIGLYLTISIGMMTLAVWVTVEHSIAGVLLFIPTAIWVGCAGVGMLAGCIYHGWGVR